VIGKCQQRAFPVNLTALPNFRLARNPYRVRLTEWTGQ
jgi:hypothetical protein